MLYVGMMKELLLVFTLNDMRTLLNARPFVPFRLWTNDSGHVDIRSPELVLPGRRFVLIGILDPSTAEEGYDRYLTVWYMHVTRHEPLGPGASPFASPGEPPSGTPEQMTGS